tara:strand:+ start:244 stop:513 length:270 start_codon:yes stop_codon:yes gene_type:complete
MTENKSLTNEEEERLMEVITANFVLTEAQGQLRIQLFNLIADVFSAGKDLDSDDVIEALAQAVERMNGIVSNFTILHKVTNIHGSEETH